MTKRLASMLTILLLIATCYPAQAQTTAFTKLKKNNSPRITPVVRVVHNVGPSVVNITTAKVVERTVSPFAGRFHDPFFNEFFGRQGIKRRFRQQSLGSGVIIDGHKGLVLTNAHVIEGATSISTRLMDGRTFEAELVGADTDFDLAVLRLKNGKNLPESPMADSSDILPGETVIAIGNPYGFGHTATTGVVSALNRSIKTEQGYFTDFIQTDTAINPGNSGGPLLNILGELIGINTAIFAKAEGIGFAIPINKARRVVEQLLYQGSVSPVWLGLSGQNIDQRMASWLGLKDLQGMVVTEVFKNSPAAHAKIAVGDAILSINGNSIEDNAHYQQLLRNYTTGQEIAVSLIREGKTKKVTLKVQKLNKSLATQLAIQRWGISVSPKGKSLIVKSVRKGSPADALGLQSGDQLAKIGGMELSDTDSFTNAFIRYRLDGTIMMLVGRKGRGYHARMKIQ